MTVTRGDEMGKPIESTVASVNGTSGTTFDIDTLFREFMNFPRQSGKNTAELVDLYLVENGSSSSVSSGPDCPTTKPSNELPGEIIDFGTGSDFDTAEENAPRRHLPENESIKLFRELLQNGSDKKLAKEIQDLLRNGSDQDLAKQIQELLRKNPDSELVKEIEELLGRNSDRELARQVQELLRKNPDRELAKEIQELLRKNSDREFTIQIQDLLRKNPDNDLAKEIGKLLQKRSEKESDKQIQDLFRNDRDDTPATETPGPAGKLGISRPIERYRKRESDRPSEQEKPSEKSRQNERELIKPFDRLPLPKLEESFELLNRIFTERIRRLEEVPLRRVFALDEDISQPQMRKELDTEIQRGRSNKELLKVLHQYQKFLEISDRTDDAKKVMERSNELETRMNKPWESLDKDVMDRIDGAVTGKMPLLEKKDFEVASRIYKNIEDLFDKNGEKDSPLLVGYLRWHRFFAEQLKDTALTEQLTERIESIIQVNRARQYAR